MRVLSIPCAICLLMACGGDTSIDGGSGGNQGGSGGQTVSTGGGENPEAEAYEMARNTLDACGLASPCPPVPHVEHPTDAEDEYRCILETLVTEESGHFGDSYTPEPGAVTVTRDIYVFSEAEVIVLGKSEPTSRGDSAPSYGAQRCGLQPKAELQTCLDKMDANDPSWGDMGVCLNWYQGCEDVALSDAACP